MFRFENPSLLYLLVLIPILAFIGLFLIQRRSRALKRFGEEELINSLMPNSSAIRPMVKYYIMLIALTALIVTAANPQFGTKLEKVKRKGIEIMIALDVSNSMNAKDIQPSRLSRAKMAVSQLVDKLHNDKVGLVVFAGQAYTQLPITTDYSAAKLFLSTINTEMIGEQGTNIAAAINRCVNSFGPNDNINRAIVVITDGENHQSDAIAAAEAAADKNIKVYTVGMGLPKGAPIPVEGGNEGDFIKDQSGNVVISKLNEDMLAKIAVAGDGAFIPANNIRKGMNNLVDNLSKIEKSEIEGKVYSEYKNQFQYIAVIALLFLFLDFLILERKNKFLRKLNLFEVKKQKEF